MARRGVPDRRLRTRKWRKGDNQSFIEAFEGLYRGPKGSYPGPHTHDWSQGPPGHTWTLYRWSGEIVGIAGAIPAFDDDGAWRVWSMLADLSTRDWVQALWLAGRALDDMIRQGAPSFRAMTPKRLKGGVGVLQRLGFEFEYQWEDFVMMRRRVTR